LKRALRKSGEHTAGKFGFKMSLKQLFFLALSIVLLIYAFRYVGFEGMLEQLGSLRWLYLIPVVGLSIAVILLDSYKHKLLACRIDPKIKYWSIVPVYLVGMLFNALTPGARNGGEFVKSFYFTKISPKINYYQGLAISFIAGTVIHLAFGPIAILSILGVLIFANVSGNLATFMIILLLVFLALTSVAFALHRNRHVLAQSPLFEVMLKFNYWLTKRRLFASYSLYKGSAVLKFSKFTNAWEKYTKESGLLQKAIFLQLASLLCEFLRVYILFASFRYPISFITVVVIVAVAKLAGYLLILPGGVGVTEASLLSLYHLFGVVPGVAAAVTLIDRAAHYMINMYGGGLAAFGWLSLKYHFKPAIESVVMSKKNGKKSE
jgi:hypothetical protein